MKSISLTLNLASSSSHALRFIASNAAKNQFSFIMASYLPSGPTGILIARLSSNYIDSSVTGILKGITNGIKKTGTFSQASLSIVSYAGIFYFCNNAVNYNPWTVIISYTISYGLDYLLKKSHPLCPNIVQEFEHKYQKSRKDGQKIAYQKSWKKLFCSLLKLPLVLIPHGQIRIFCKLVCEFLIDSFLALQLDKKRSPLNKIYKNLFPRTNWNKISTRAVAMISLLNSSVAFLTNSVTKSQETASVPEIFAGEAIKFITIKEQKFMNDYTEEQTSKQLINTNNFIKRIISSKAQTIISLN